MSLPAPAPVSVARQVVRRLNRLRWGVTGLLLLAALGWTGRWAWLRWETNEVPVDWAGFWSGDRAFGLGQKFPVRLEGARIDTVDGDAAFQSDGRPAANEFANLGSWEVGPVWTLAGWFRLESFPGDDSVWTSLAGGMRDGFWRFGVLGRHPTASIGPTGSEFRLASPQPFVLERWTHLAAAGSPTHLRLFVDGELAAEHPIPTGSPLTMPPGGFLHYIGGGGDELPYRRQVDDYAVFGRNLSAGEIAGLHRVGRGGALRLRVEFSRWNDCAVKTLPWVTALLAFLWFAPWLVGWSRRMFLPGPGFHGRSFATVWIVLTVGAAVTALATRVTSTWITTGARHHFESEVQRIHQELDGYFERLVSALQMLRESTFSQPQVGLADWNRGVNAMNMTGDFPAVLLSGFAELVWPEERAAHEAHWRQQLGASYRVKPELPFNERNAYLGVLSNAVLPIVFGRYGNSLGTVAPTPQDYLGQDLLAVAGHTPDKDMIAYKVSAALGTRPWSAPPAALALPDNPEASLAGVPILMPVKWREPVPPRGDRRGVLFGLVSLDRLFAGAFDARVPDFGLRMVYGNTRGSVAFPAFDSRTLWPQTAEPRSPWFRTEREVFLYRGRLFCDFWTTPAFDRHQHRHAPWLVALAGAAFTLLTAGLVAGQVRARLTETAVAENLRGLNAELAAATKERARLSRDLHDGTIQNLYALGLEIGQARTLVTDDPARAKAELGRTLTTLQAAITELRQFVLELEPEAWQGQSVRSALEALVARLRRTTTLEFKLDIAPAAEVLPAKTAIHVLQLMREGLSNVLRHADAGNVWVKLDIGSRGEGAPGGEGDWTLEIRDDGQGFEVPAKAANGGRGLRSFRERAAELGGRCEIHSTPGAGTRVVVIFPQPTSP